MFPTRRTIAFAVGKKTGIYRCLTCCDDSPRNHRMFRLLMIEAANTGHNHRRGCGN